MFVVAVTTIAATPIITQVKLKKPSKIPHGQFACFYDTDGRLKQQQAAERNVGAIEDRNSQGTCELKNNRAIEGFMIYMVGPGAPTGGQYSQGQFVSTYVPKFDSDTITIRLGKPGYHSTNGPKFEPHEESVTRFSGVQSLRAYGGIQPINGNLVGFNIAGCMLRSAGDQCSRTLDHDGKMDSGWQRHCRVTYSDRIPNSEQGKPQYQLLIQGCRAFTEYVNPYLVDPENLDKTNMETDKLIELDKLIPQGGTTDPHWSFRSSSILDKYDIGLSNAVGVTPVTYDVLLNIQLKDPEFIATTNTNSKMADILKTLPASRKTAISQKIIQLQPGVGNSGTGRYGAVFILW